ncbi:hypothetical protein C8J57DRAFT_1523352 [Mycena rebaudengoi]|nr:hypothetical protein C8J57DRAFT_1523352 [Mycena rebaudengoi]
MEAGKNDTKKAETDALTYEARTSLVKNLKLLTQYPAPMHHDETWFNPSSTCVEPADFRFFPFESPHPLCRHRLRRGRIHDRVSLLFFSLFYSTLVFPPPFDSLDERCRDSLTRCVPAALIPLRAVPGEQRARSIATLCGSVSRYAPARAWRARCMFTAAEIPSLATPARSFFCPPGCSRAESRPASSVVRAGCTQHAAREHIQRPTQAGALPECFVPLPFPPLVPTSRSSLPSLLVRTTASPSTHTRRAARSDTAASAKQRYFVKATNS